MSVQPRASVQVRQLRRWCDRLLTAVFRWRCDGIAEMPREPCLVVGNHGFGSLTDLNVIALNAALHRIAGERASSTLVHQVAWSVGLGPVLELLGCAPAGDGTARAAFAAGHHVAVFPGGDIEAAKTFRDRHRVIFSGRSGFARLALQCDVPIVPVVTAGGGATALVLSDGQGLARALRLDRSLRVKALPVSLSLPWGFSIGVAGFLPYLPLPATIRTRALEPVRALPGESAPDLARRVESLMQAALDDIARR